MIFKSSVVTWKLKAGTYSSETCTFDAESVLNTASNESATSMPQITETTPTTVNVQVSSGVAKQSLEPAAFKFAEDTNNTTVNGNTQQTTDIQSVSVPSATVLGKIETVRPAVSGFYNPVNATPLVDGMVAAVTEVSDPRPKWMNLPYALRKKRADVYLKTDSKEEYALKLGEFLKSKGLIVLPYDDAVHYLPSDILLIDKEDLVDQGTVIELSCGKRAVYNALLAEFGDRLK